MPNNRVLNEEQDKEVGKLYLEEKLSCNQISDIFDVSCSAIVNSLKRSKVQIRTRSEAIKYNGPNNSEYLEKRKLRMLTNNPMKREETRKKVSKKLTGRKIPELTGNNNPAKRPEVREKISRAKKGIKFSKEHKMKLSKAKKGKKLPEEHKRKISESHKGKYTGSNSWAWKGGVSFEPYCILFNKEFKERVRNFFKRRCGLCGKSEEENNKRLNVHHITYNKKACCDDESPLFIPLCNSCHIGTNHNREYWEELLYYIVMFEYGGKCYLSKEEIL